MALIKFEPLRELESLNNRIMRMFGDFPGITDMAFNFNPKVDISENEKNFIVEAEIPGVKKEDMKISLQENILTISGEKKTETSEKKEKNFYRSERSYGTFTRSFTLPEEVNPDKVDAKFENGVLRITLEKAAPKPVNEKLIEIK